MTDEQCNLNECSMDTINKLDKQLRSVRLDDPMPLEEPVPKWTPPVSTATRKDWQRLMEDLRYVSAGT